MTYRVLFHVKRIPDELATDPGAGNGRKRTRNDLTGIKLIKISEIMIQMLTLRSTEEIKS